MSSRIDNFIIRQPDGATRFANSLVLGEGLRLGETAGGIPELTGITEEPYLTPSGGDDTSRIQAALNRPGVARVRLAPGTFHTQTALTLGPGQVLVGSGAANTILSTTSGGYTIMLGTHDSGLEELTLGTAGISSGVRGTGTNLWVDGVRITSGTTGIYLSGDRLAVRRTTVEGVSQNAMQFTTGEQVDVSDVAISGGAIVGLYFTGLDNVSVTRVTLRECDTGIVVNGGSSHTFTGIRMSACTQAMQMDTCGSVALAGVQAAECGGGFSFASSTQLSIAACSLTHGSMTALSLDNCHDVTVGPFHADLSNSFGAPHVVVGGGSTLVFFTTLQRVTGPFAGPYELDVSGAGGRVLFAQQNFTPSKINSGGNFVAL